MNTSTTYYPWPLQDILVLRGIKRLSAKQALTTIHRFASLDEAWHHPHGLGAHSALQLFGESLRRLRKQAREIIAECSDEGIDITTFFDVAYPALLREISSPPLVLFVKGTLPDADFLGCGIVGTRACTDYGRRVTEWFAQECASHNLAVVSGLANGIDAYAHTKSIQSGGITIAVIASGISAISPWQSAELATKIAENAGCVVSEYRPGTKALPAFFPQRNRIISGMSKCVLVVESKIKGGGLITAKFAMDQNRDVFAVPGSVYSSRSAGTNALIRNQQATSVSSPSELFEAIGVNPQEHFQHIELSQDQAQALEMLESGPKHLEEIVAHLGMHVHVLQPALLDLELRGVIQRDSAMRFTLLQSI